MRNTPATAPSSIARQLTTETVSERTGIPAPTLKRWRIDGSGPPYVKLGRRVVRYPEDLLESWIANRVRRSTREPMGAA